MADHRPKYLLGKYPTRAELRRPAGQHVCNTECLCIRLAARDLLQGVLSARGTSGMAAKLLEQLNPARHALRANQTTMIQAVAGRGSAAPGLTPAAIVRAGSGLRAHGTTTPARAVPKHSTDSPTARLVAVQAQVVLAGPSALRKL